MYRHTSILYRILDSFFRHQLLFWGAVFLVSSMTMAALYARSKTYHATALTQVQTNSVATVLQGNDNYGWTSPSQKNVDHFMELAKQSQPGGFLDTALKNANLASPINVDPESDDPRSALLQKNLLANAESANQFSINLTWGNQEECKDITDALQKQYITEVGLDRSSNSIASVHFLDSQIADVTLKLHTAEKALSDFKASNGGQLSDAESSYNNQLSSLEAEVTDKQITLGENEKKKTYLQGQLALIKPMSIAEQKISDQSPLEVEVAGLLAHREAVLASRGGLTPMHPEVVAIDDQIKRLENQERSNAKAPENHHNTQTTLQDNPQYQALREQIADAAIAQAAEEMEMQNLHQQIIKYKGLVNTIPAAQRQLADKTRDYSSLSDLYNTLWKKRQDVQLTSNLDRLTASASLMPIGVTYATPTTGKTKLIAMLFGSIVLGCLVGVILIVLSEWSDHSLRYESDTERLLGVPVLALLPDTEDLRMTAPHRSLTRGMAALPSPATES
jgi:uncharacterized protein involved in exopolysaccharide biosynthesis